MARFETFDQDIRLATAGLSDEAISVELAKLAKSELAKAISSGQGSKIYERYVNGVFGAPEEAVKAPGPIVYLFSWWPEIVEFALEALVRRSPRRSGRYQESWFAMVGGSRVADFTTIPVDSEVILTNDQPYSRKIEVGHMKMSVPPGVVEATKVVVRRQYGAIMNVRATMINLAAGGYVLKGHFTKGVGKFARTKLRKDTEAGAKMTYPALVLSLKA